MQPSGKSWPTRGRKHSAIPSPSRGWGIPPPQGRMRLLKKSGLGVRRLAAISASVAGAGRRLRRLANKGGGGSAHMSAGKSLWNILPVALPLPQSLREKPPPQHQRPPPTLGQWLFATLTHAPARAHSRTHILIIWSFLMYLKQF